MVKTGMEEAYVQHLHSETLPQLSALPGFISMTIMRRSARDATEFRLVTVWESMVAIEAFAGKDAEVAVVPAVAQTMMLRFDPRATHYEVIGPPGGR